MFDIKTFSIEEINNGMKIIIQHNNGQTSEGEIFIYRMELLSFLKNEKGVILPFSLFLLFLFTLMTFHAAIKFQTEKQFFHNINKTHEIETLLIAGFYDAEQLYQEGTLSESGEFFYDVGQVKYQVLSETEQDLLLSFQVYTNKGGRLFYDIKMKKHENISNQSF